MILVKDAQRTLQADLKNKTLLILTPSYPNKDESFIAETFVKYQVAELRHYFQKIIVIAPVFWSLGYLKKDKLCLNYSYDNIEVYFPRCTYIPIFLLKKPIIDNRLHIVERCIRENKLYFDLIHAHFTWPSGYIGVKLKEQYGKPVITTIHENGDWFEQEIQMNHPLINTAWSGADALIRVNQKDVPVLKFYNDQVYSIPNGFSASFYPIEKNIVKEKLGLPQSSKVIFSLGGLIKRKGFNHLIDAMRRVCQQRDDVICFIGGAGPEMKNLQEQINRLHLGERVKLLGSLPNDQLTLWMNACDFFVLPSFNEGNPTVMFEALGCGKPYVGTGVGGVPEIITSNDYGLIVEPGNSEDLAEKILLALDKTWDRDAIIKYGERFSWDKIMKETMEIYLKII